MNKIVQGKRSSGPKRGEEIALRKTWKKKYGGEQISE